MDRQYQQVYPQRNISLQGVKSNILRLYRHLDPAKRYNFDEVLYIFDQQCAARKCDRDVCHELFQQAVGDDNTVLLQDVVDRYLENVETSKLCLLRDQYRLEQLSNQVQTIQDRDKTFVFLKIVQVEVYSRFTKSPTFQYKIAPTDIPTVTLTNSYNPTLNHEFVLQMEEPEFSIVFYESGVEIFTWNFPDRPFLEEGEHDRVVQSENVSFEVKIKYVPREQIKTKQTLNKEIATVNQKIDRERQAFHKLCVFEPFNEPLPRKKRAVQEEISGTALIFSCFPCCRQHFLVLHFLLILTILLQSWAASFWPLQFLDLCFCFFAIGQMYDKSIVDYSLKLLILQLTLLLLTLKSIWGAVEQPYFAKTDINRNLMVLCIAIKVILFLALTVSLVRRDEIADQRITLLTGQEQPKMEQLRQSLREQIWES